MYELIVVGAGVAGCMAAMRAAEKGIKVLLLDKRSTEKIGHDWTNGVEKRVFPEVGLNPPSGAELALQQGRFRLVSPSGRFVEAPRVPMYEVSMRPFTARLLKSALKAGVDFQENTEIAGPLIQNGKVGGVVVAGGREITARVVMDASGYDAAIKNKLPRTSPMSSETDDRINLTAWRGQIHIADPKLDVPRLVDIPSDVTVSRAGWLGGYSIFSLCWHSAERALDILIGFDRQKSDVTAQQYFNDFLAKHNLKGSMVYGGGGMIPVRRSLDILVDDNFLIAGDSACMVIPIHSSGVACSLIAGNLAAETVANCIRQGKTGKEALWGYAAEYQRGRGAMMGFFDVMRLIFEKLTAEEMNKLVGYAMLAGDMVAGLEARSPRITIGDTLARLRGLRYPLLTARFGLLIKTAFDVRRHYRRYPRQYDERKIKQWQAGLRKILASVR